MNTAATAIQQLEQTTKSAQAAQKIIENLITVHDYQDVALLLAQSAEKLLEAARLMMESEDQRAIDTLELAEDLIDAVYDTIGADLDDAD